MLLPLAAACTFALGACGSGQSEPPPLAGAAIGTALGLLFAPDTGKKNRKRLAAWADEVAERSEEFWEENREPIEEAVSSTRNILFRVHHARFRHWHSYPAGRNSGRFRL
ncbi:MAG: YtxH domain-containing protein [Proteobacteria bacterium]|nr:YtxH domain-containing protein [Pseudomonadota bacterium]